MDLLENLPQTIAKVKFLDESVFVRKKRDKTIDRILALRPSCALPSIKFTFISSHYEDLYTPETENYRFLESIKVGSMIDLRY